MNIELYNLLNLMKSKSLISQKCLTANVKNLFTLLYFSCRIKV